MNYIKHLTGFFDRVVRDNNLNPTHISLYVSLFQFWNVKRFINPISISRDEVMRISKISAKATYHKCMRELHQHGYLRYEPSFNPFRGSLVHLMNFEDDLKPVQKRVRQSKAINQPAVEQVLNRYQAGNGTATEQALVPSINNTNNLNNVNNLNGSESSKIAVKVLLPVKKKEKSSAKKERKAVIPVKEGSAQFIVPKLNDVQEFFSSQNYPAIEADKFYNYFQSNGWLVGGKTKMKDWHAAGRSWMLNSQQFAAGRSVKPNAKQLHASTDKNYSEPL